MATKEEFERTLKGSFEGALIVWFAREFNKRENIGDSWLYLWFGIVLEGIKPSYMDERNLDGSKYIIEFKAKIIHDKVLLKEPKNADEAIEILRNIDFNIDALNNWKKHFGLD